MKKQFFIFLLSLLPCTIMAQRGMNRPYIDDKVFHFGFSLGVNFMDYSFQNVPQPLTGAIKDAQDMPTDLENAYIHTRCSYMVPGFTVGFIADVRLCRYLNLRLIPQLHFADREFYYKYETVNDNGELIESPDKYKTTLLSIPIAIPLELKWSAERYGNVRPYCTIGGGVSYNCLEDRKKPLIPKRLDYFMEIGAGCDFYFSWFKLCPQIKYQLGFANLAPEHYPQGEPLNSAAISRMRSHAICIVFNFE